MSTTDPGVSWFKSSYSSQDGGDCIEVAPTPHTVHVRDSKDPEGPILRFTPDAWTRFVALVVATDQEPRTH
ncbi:DUF397 domain-containing protein [Streptomyces sp. CMB-StM0423]|uniref:DUF397 domain-containing protein n=1 Tax=Streptomyces sp. CMB-StM0423 TaxID=2059884 RepID=UPI000C70A12A|nr:DUF397 domain-containing protein [Streptomyces sp. CMB-StM0423]AUH42795.1 DUF397 domain-containing protein [Streptomyces sp. CMB-StM0423]